MGEGAMSGSPAPPQELALFGREPLVPEAEIRLLGFGATCWYSEPWYLSCNPWNLTGLADLFGSAGPRPV